MNKNTLPDVDACEGCELPGSIDWCGNWLCPDCYQIEREHADPIFAASKELEAKSAKCKALVDSWPASSRGDNRSFMRNWSDGCVRHAERTQAC